MGLVKCKQCENEMSSRAEACPKCGHPTKMARPHEMAPCRACGTSLEIAKHKFYEYIDAGIVDGTSRVHQKLCHKPCPNCGEPEPLKRAQDTAKFGCLVLPVLVFLPVLVAIKVDATFWPYGSYSQGNSLKYLGYNIGVYLITLFGLLWILKRFTNWNLKR